MHDSPKTNAIRQRMEEVRCDLDEGVQEIVEGARVMGMWRHYVRTYPWICLGAAVAGGYLIVPRVLGGQGDVQTRAESAYPSHLLMTPNAPPKGIARGILLAFVGNLAMRCVSSYALQLSEHLIATRAAKSQQDVQL